MFQRRVDDLLLRQKELNQQLNMTEDSVAQLNNLLTMLYDSKEVRTNKNTQLSRPFFLNTSNKNEKMGAHQSRTGITPLASRSF